MFVKPRVERFRAGIGWGGPWEVGVNLSVNRPRLVEALKPREGGPVSAPRKYPDELRELAVRMVFEMHEQTGQRKGALARVAEQLGVNPETLRN
jgi:hypothetical protein